MIEDKEHAASYLSTTIRHDLLPEDYSYWSKAKLNEATDIIEGWIHRREITSNGIAAELDKLTRHLEELQNEYENNKDAIVRNRYEGVNWSEVQNKLVGANIRLIDYQQSPGQTFLGHPNASEYLQRQEKQTSLSAKGTCEQLQAVSGA